MLFICVYIYIYIYTVYICMYVHMYIYMYTHIVHSRTSRRRISFSQDEKLREWLRISFFFRSSLRFEIRAFA